MDRQFPSNTLPLLHNKQSMLRWVQKAKFVAQLTFSGCSSATLALVPYNHSTSSFENLTMFADCRYSCIVFLATS